LEEADEGVEKRAMLSKSPDIQAAFSLAFKLAISEAYIRTERIWLQYCHNHKWKRQAPDLPWSVDSIMRPARPRNQPRRNNQASYFQVDYCGSLSFGGVESGPASASVVVNRSLAAARKSRIVGALDLSNNASSSGAVS
jgi:hypothetical protein